MYRFEGKYRVTGIEHEPNNVVKLRLEGDAGVMSIELPAILAKVKQNDEVLVSLSSDKDENYKDKWDIYMWGIVYHSGNDFIRLSIGGFILHAQGPITGNRPNVGDKLYVGLKITQSA